MPIAVQEHLLDGDSTLARFTHAKQLGFDGVEVAADDSFFDRFADIMRARVEVGIAVSALNAGQTHLIHPDYNVRESALTHMRQLMTVAADLEAQGVVFMGHYAPYAVLPDLHPYKSSVELEAEMLITQLRATLCDFAQAIGTQLLLEHSNSEESVLLRQVAHAAVICDKLDHHPYLGITANTYHMAKEGDLFGDTLPNFPVKYLHLSDAEHRLPLENDFDFEGLAAALNAMNYTGWITLESAAYGDDPGACLATLRKANIS